MSTVLTAVQAEPSQAAVAGWLSDRGVEQGARVAMIGDQTVEFLCSVMGALRSGVIPVVIKPQLTETERQHILNDAAPQIIMGTNDQRDAVVHNVRAELAEIPLARPMMYTSGTTGRPKGVWSGVLDENDARLLIAEEWDLWGHDSDDVHLVVAPLSHSAPLRFAMCTLLAGGSVVLPSYRVGVARSISEVSPTSTFLAPPHLDRLRAELDAVDVSSFRLVAHAGAPCPSELKRWAIDRFAPGSVWEFYGSTEGQFTACSPQEWMDRPGTVGRARQGRTLSVREGIIWCGVPRHARFGYWQNPTATEAAWDGDAFSVFDLGELDDDGYLRFKGRRTDLIISGGVNVYPLEVEQVLAAHPGVESATVVGVDDPQWGERVCAVVVADVDQQDLSTWARKRLAPWKRPKSYLRVTEVPTNSMGKIDRAELAAMITADS